MNTALILGLGSFYLFIFVAFFAIMISEMPRFFADMPKRSEWFERKKVKLQVYYNFPDRRSIQVASKKKKGFIIVHYIRVRMLAYKYDKNPLYMGEDAEFGVSWDIRAA